MLIPVPPKSRKRDAKRRAVRPLKLVAATYTEGTSVTLTFDRAVEVAGIDVAAITVADEAAGYLFEGTGAATPLSETSVLVPLVDVEQSPVAGTLLTAGAGTGIVADDDGGTWAGVTDLALPYP